MELKQKLKYITTKGWEGWRDPNLSPNIKVPQTSPIHFSQFGKNLNAWIQELQLEIWPTVICTCRRGWVEESS